MLLRLIVLVVVLGAIAVFALGYRWGDTRADGPEPVEVGGNTIDAEGARRAGAEIASKVAEGASRAGKALEESKLTAKIKSKMALDDHVKARAIDVDTSDGVATLSGIVASGDERKRAVQLARDTEGITRVVDELEVRNR
jgi:osmotically-inducible protein OsmY